MPASNPDTLLHTLMGQALEQAQAASAAAEVPVGAVVVGPDGTVLAAAHNLVETKRSALAHAELLALEAALAKVGEKYLTGCTVVVTLEPCPMCMGALAHARVARVVFGAFDPKSGGTVSGPRVAAFTHHKPEIIGGIRAAEGAALLKTFFAARRG